ncbi:hypothetical protein BGW36DRAFT_394652 [Talaromyces proteolyticus]|uniref:SPIN90/Ldb17 leucine-rich domain-containing protein n=1 Tax=Talaromyces proteolyticus TaxID=1131652 RepID=A0AAD4KWQ0_9EURO|nr:uncharacterized protein BGW36DRAFT_394652 [Talaromyces proteolyticus]KAH8701859.1 hypothetical protein BGW36DRAFT_394652 [Talaromyces proteolyticus]
MDLEEGSYNLENEQQFWDQLDDILSKPYDSHELIDNALRDYLGFSARFKRQFLNGEYDVSRCSYKLFSSNLFAQHADYIRRQIIYSLLQEDDSDALHFMAAFLLFDGRHNDTTLQLMNDEGCFPRLLELIRSQDPAIDDDGAGLHRHLMDLLYEMSRIQRIKIEDLVLVEDDFVKYLFEIIEGLSNDANDPYHYPVIRILLVLNEQFMVSAHDPDLGASSNPPTNKVIKILAMHGNFYKTFGENIILLLNREGETSLQLLTLKLLYLIFTTPSTYEYFYTNDLRVLVDILIRNLLDLPEDAVALRHTYLRVFYPLLSHTQLKYAPHYKRDEIMRTLGILIHSQFDGAEDDYEKILHFAEADDTTKRLVTRCGQVEWLRGPEPESISESPQDEESPSDTNIGVPIIYTDSASERNASIATSPISQDSITPSSPTKVNSKSPSMPSSIPKGPKGKLGMQLEPASSSALSFVEVAAQNEKPGVMTPSRRDTKSSDHSIESILAVRTKQKPELPKARRWRGRRACEEDEGGGGGGGGGEKHALESEEKTTAASNERRASTEESFSPSAPAARSTSRSAPALPPPRRSFNHTSTTVAAPAVVDNHSAKLSVKPEPPKTRRWRHGAKPPAEPSMAEEVEKA